MNVIVPLLITLPLFFLGYMIYSRYIGRIFQSDDANTTPANELRDDRDFVPTKGFVLFGHHFASIAGGGPIIGPTLAILYGYIPVWLWLLFGAVFLGAVHDMSSLFTSLREKGRSMAEVAGSTLGRAGFLIFIGFTIIMLLMVTSVFLKLSAKSLTSLVPVAALNLEGTSIPVKVVMQNGAEYFHIGGIASTSVIIISLFAPLIGYLLYRKNASVYYITPLCLALAAFSVAVGVKYPVHIDTNSWMIILSVYTLFAAGIPVWLILQPRDFTNVFLLYGGIVALLLAGIVAGLKGVTINAPAFNVAQGSARIGPLFPILFITVACGAISGFHSLVASGTSSKQVSRESDVRRIGYGGMILEGVLALLVLLAIGAGMEFSDFVNIVYPAGKGGNPILGFAMGMGGLLEKGLGINPVLGIVFGILMVEGFVVTTLDTAVRLNRYLFEELWGLIFRTVPRIMKTYVFNSLLCVLMMYGLAKTNTIMDLWKIFGTANQLMAALTLIAVAAWLYARSRRKWFVVWPAAFMMILTVTALVWLLLTSYIPSGNLILCTADVVLLALAVGVIALCVKFIRNRPTSAAAA